MMEIVPIARYQGSFGSKFGIPRQSGIVPELEGRIVFEDKYRVREALRGLEDFSHIWLLWGFSANKPAKGEWQPTVRPPRLGGNTSVGVFASRSPYHPNSIGLSCVELCAIDGLDLIVRGADLADGTPIFDIKPYISYADSFPEARCGFARKAPEAVLEVEIPADIPLSDAQRATLSHILSLDPRPAYQDDPAREYAMVYDGSDLRFKVIGNKLFVISYGD
ncbi:MAG: tRNA (N6-threonylcarbamoyladenosine(37)-N6)-methyltransferase TrmO [Bacteroidales bacterium]|nr:tRNA (N6-threonylcarbamoyladenosine(37)-N6)-methyltransferase TrmO [Bacteroidales bacterium]